MKKKVGQVVFTGVQTEKLAVEHMRKPGQRMPVSNIRKTKRPLDPLDRHSIFDVLILGHVQSVIETDKFVMAYLPINTKCGNNQHHTD